MSETQDMLEEYQSETILTLDECEPYIGRERVDTLTRLAASVAGKGWANINSTFVGGGVAEMLRSVIPLARSLGVHARWYTIQGHDAFFQATKKFHNTLQGVNQPITLQELFETYLDNLETNATNVSLESDLIVVHDLQPAQLGRQAQEHVRQNFLLPELVRRYLTLPRYYTGIDPDYPSFRMNPISYRERLARLLPPLAHP